MAKTNIIISDAAQRYIDDRINADHIATRAIALSITTFGGVPHVYTGNITETRIFIKRDENVDEAIAQAFGIEDEQDTNEPESIEEQEENMKTTNTTTDNTSAPTEEATQQAWTEFCALLEDNGMVIDDVEMCDTTPDGYSARRLSATIIGYTDLGGEQIHTLDCEHYDDASDIAAAFYKTVEYFDPWEEAHLWMVDGIPADRTPFDKSSDGGRELLRDMDEYYDFLNTLADEVFAWARDF